MDVATFVIARPRAAGPAARRVPDHVRSRSRRRGVGSLPARTRWRTRDPPRYATQAFRREMRTEELSVPTPVIAPGADPHPLARGDLPLLRARAARPGHRALGRAARRRSAGDPRARQRLRPLRGRRHPARRSAGQAGGRARAAADLHRRLRAGRAEHLLGQPHPQRYAASPAASTRTGRPAQTDRVASDDPILALAAWRRPLHSLIGGADHRRRIDLRRPPARPTGARAGPTRARDNELLRIFAAYMSSSIQNALDAIRARALARLDHLTGLSNSRYFHMRLQDEIARADHEGTDLSMLFIDLDNFKAVNDRFGHLAGSWTAARGGRACCRENAPAGHRAGALRRRRVRRHPARRRSRSALARPPRRCAEAIASAVFFDPESEHGPDPRTPLPRRDGVDRDRVVPRPPGAGWQPAAA